MNVTHDAAGLIFTMSAHGRDISFNLCRKEALIKDAYVRRGTSKNDFSYMSIQNLVNKKGFDAVKAFHGDLWKDVDHAELMKEVANWLSKVDNVHRNDFYQMHFAGLVA